MTMVGDCVDKIKDENWVKRDEDSTEMFFFQFVSGDTGKKEKLYGFVWEECVPFPLYSVFGYFYSLAMGVGLIEPFGPTSRATDWPCDHPSFVRYCSDQFWNFKLHTPSG